MAKRRLYLGAFSAVAVALGMIGSTAWACTAFTSLRGVQSGLANSRVEMTGESLVRPNERVRAVELRWNSLQGPILAQAEADHTGKLSTTVTIPEAAPGTYFVVAIVQGRAVARSIFEVVAAPGTAPAPAAALELGLRATDRPALQTDRGLGLEPGIALLAVGLVLLVAGAGVAAARSGRRAASGVDLTK